MILKVNEDYYINFDIDTRQIDLIVKSELEQAIADVQTRLDGIPAGPTDEELLSWARANYPLIQVDRAALEARLAEIDSLLTIK